MAKTLQQIYTNAAWTHEQLRRFSLPEPAASYATYQIYFETNAYTNAGWNLYRNASGIMYAGQKGAKKGPNNYAMFDSFDNYFRSFVHELQKGTNPAGAASLEDYVKRLKANRYFQAKESDYLSGLKRARLVLKVIPAADRAGSSPDGTTQNAGDIDIPGSTDYRKPPLLGIAAAAVLFLLGKKLLG